MNFILQCLIINITHHPSFSHGLRASTSRKPFNVLNGVLNFMEILQTGKPARFRQTGKRNDQARSGVFVVIDPGGKHHLVVAAARRYHGKTIFDSGNSGVEKIWPIV